MDAWNKINELICATPFAQDAIAAICTTVQGSDTTGDATGIEAGNKK